MTNYEKIKSMSFEEMADFIYVMNNIECLPCNNNHCDGYSDSQLTCLKGIKQWLNAKSAGKRYIL